MTLQLELATSRRQRRQGLLDREALAERSGLLIPRCRSVHTFGMRFPIAVVFLDRAWQAVDVVFAPPGRLLLPRRKARHVLECRPEDAPQVGSSLEHAIPRELAR